MYVWNTATLERIYENIWKSSKLQFQFFDERFEICLNCHQDNVLKTYSCIDNGMQLNEYRLEQDIFFTCYDLYFDIDVVFFGTNKGTVRLYMWPFDIFKKEITQYLEIPISCGPISIIKHSYDGSFLLVGSQDGQIYFIRLQEVKNGVEIENWYEYSKKINAFAYYLNEFEFSSKANRDMKLEQIKELLFRIDILKNDIDDEKEKIISQYNSQIQQKEETNKLFINQQKEMLSKQMEICVSNSRQIQIQMEETHSQYAKLKRILSKDQENQLRQSYQEIDQLQKDLKDEKYQCEIHINKLKLALQEKLDQQNQAYKNEINDLNNRIQQAQNNFEFNKLRSNEILRQESDEQIFFIKKIREIMVKEIDEEQNQYEFYRTNIKKNKKECERFINRKEEVIYLIDETQNLIKNLEEENIKFQNVKNMMNVFQFELLKKEQLANKESIIYQKEQEIKDHIIQNKYLKNFQTVFNYRQKQITDQKVPLQNHLTVINTNFKEIYQELFDEYNQKKKFQIQMQDQIKKQEVYKESLKQCNEYDFYTKRCLEKFQFDIIDLIHNIQQSEWKQTLQKYYKEYFDSQEGKIVELRNFYLFFNKINIKVQNQQNDHSAQQISSELVNQRDFKSQKIVKIGKTNQFIESEKNDILVRVQNKNTQLILECNELREERKKNQELIKKLEKGLDVISVDLIDLNLQKKSCDHSLQQDQMNKQNSEEEQKNEFIKLDQNKAQQKKEQKKIIPFARYHSENNIFSKKNQKSLQQNVSQDNVIKSMIKEIQASNNQQHDKNFAKLKEKVQNFIYCDLDTLTLPQISRIDRAIQLSQLSQEETHLPVNSETNIPVHSLITNRSVTQLMKDAKIIPDIYKKRSATQLYNGNLNEQLSNTLLVKKQEIQIIDLKNRQNNRIKVSRSITQLPIINKQLINKNDII